LRLEVPPDVAEVRLLYHSAVQSTARIVTLLAGEASLAAIAGLAIARRRARRADKCPGTRT